MLRPPTRLFTALSLRIRRAIRLLAAPLCRCGGWIQRRPARQRPARKKLRPAPLTLGHLEPRFLPGDGTLGSLIAAGYVLPDGATVGQASQSLAAVAPSTTPASNTLSASSSSLQDYSFLGQDDSSGLPLPGLDTALASLSAVSASLAAANTSSPASAGGASLTADSASSTSTFGPDLSAGLDALWGATPSASASSARKTASPPSTSNASNGPNLAAGAGGGSAGSTSGSSEVNGTLPASGTTGSSSVNTGGTGGNGTNLSQSTLTAMTAGQPAGATASASSASTSTAATTDNGLPPAQASGVITPLVLSGPAAGGSADPSADPAAAGNSLTTTPDSSSDPASVTTATPDISTTGTDATAGAATLAGAVAPVDNTIPPLQLTDPTSSGQPAAGSAPGGSASPAFSLPGSGNPIYLPQTASTTTLTTSASTLAPNQPVTFTATVAPSGGSGVPTGTVAFYDGATLLGTQNLSVSGGKDLATYSTSSLPLGSQTITAIYGGDSTFAASSNALTQTVAPAVTSLGLSSTSSSLLPGQSLTLTATVNVVTGSSGFTGTVSFDDGTTLLGTAPVTLNGSLYQATFSPTGGLTSLGSHNLTAVYGGDNVHAGSVAVLNETVALGPTSLSLSSSSSSIAPNGSLTLTASVSVVSGGSTPTGSVTFYDGGTSLGTQTLTQNGSQYKSTLTTTALATLGYHSLTAVYMGDSTHAGSTDALSQLVAPASTTLSLAASPSPSSPGQQVTFTATVSPSTGSVVPTGTVTFYDGQTQLGSGPVSLSGIAGNDRATLQVALSSAGTHDITALYSGDGNFAGSSSYRSQTVTGSSSGQGTNTSLASSANPSTLGQTVTYTATVSPSGGSGTPTGTVVFYDGSTSLGSGTLAVVGGKDQASVAVPSTQHSQALTAGVHAITAIYSGDSTYLPSTASLPYPNTLQTVNETTAQESITASPTYSYPSQLVTLTATLSNPSGGAPPIGSVTFYDGANAIGSSVPLTGISGSDTATRTINTLALGSHEITAVYSGDGTYLSRSASLSSTQLESVQKSSVTEQLSTSVNPSLPGQQVSFTATLTNVSGGGPPTGTVSFYDGSTLLGTQSLSGISGSDTASQKVSTLSQGSHEITAVYNGNSMFQAAAATLPYSQTQSVSTRMPSEQLTASVNPVQPGQSVTLTATVSSSSGGSVPTGSITFMDGQTALSTVSLSPVSGKGQAVTSASLSPGKHDLVALYSGDGTYTNDSTAGMETMLAATTTTLTPSSSSPSPGQPVTLTAQVQPQSPVQGTPTGSVTLYNGNTPVATQSLPLGQSWVTFNVTTPTLTSGGGSTSVTYKAVYNADSNFATSQGVTTLLVSAPPSTVVDTTDNRNCGCPNQQADIQVPPANQQPVQASKSSPKPVRYSDGVLTYAETDLHSSGFGFDWGQTRSWSNGPGYSSGVNGNGWVDAYTPQLVQADGATRNTLIFIANATTASYFSLVGGVYQGSFSDPSQLTYNSSTDTYTLIDGQGDQIVLCGFGSSWLAGQRGQLQSYTSADGVTMTVTGYTSTGAIAQMQRSVVSNGQTVTELWLYSYLPSSDPNSGRLSSVTLEQQIGSGPATTVRQAEYTYYNGTQTYGGSLGDLMTASVFDGNGNVLQTSYYRYYTTSSSTGYPHGLQYVFNPDSYQRLTAALGTSLGSLTDAQVAPYADCAISGNAGRVKG